MPKCNMRDCGEDATKRVKMEVGEKRIPAELLVCERHLFELTDHGNKLVVKLNSHGDVEVWRPSY